MPNVDNTDSDNHDFNKDELWNKDSLKNYMLDVLNILEFSYFTLLEILSILLINDVIYWISTIHDEDFYDISFKLWKAAFAAGRLIQPEKTLRTWHWIGRAEVLIIKREVKTAMKSFQSLISIHWK